MFLQVADGGIAAEIASDMMRVTRPGGLLLLADWRYDGGRDGLRVVSMQRVSKLFESGEGDAPSKVS